MNHRIKSPDEGSNGIRRSAKNEIRARFVTFLQLLLYIEVKSINRYVKLMKPVNLAMMIKPTKHPPACICLRLALIVQQYCVGLSLLFAQHQQMFIRLDLILSFVPV